MRSILLSLSLIAAAHLASAGEDPRISTCKVTELSTTRVERVVILKKIDPQFSHSLVKIDSTNVDETQASYNVTAAQTAPAQATPIPFVIT